MYNPRPAIVTNGTIDDYYNRFDYNVGNTGVVSGAVSQHSINNEPTAVGSGQLQQQQGYNDYHGCYNGKAVAVGYSQQQQFLSPGQEQFRSAGNSYQQQQPLSTGQAAYYGQEQPPSTEKRFQPQRSPVNSMRKKSTEEWKNDKRFEEERNKILHEKVEGMRAEVEKLEKYVSRHMTYGN